MNCSNNITGIQEVDTCDKCRMVQCISECQEEVSKQLMVRSEDRNERLMHKA